MDTKALTKQLGGLSVSHITETVSELRLHFTNGSTLVFETQVTGFAVALRDVPADRGGRTADRPTQRQREYLDFIKRYILRFGIAPAESDIQQHFMVSAPSVNQMVRMLERRGFIKRSRDFSGQALPRSIRILKDAF